MKKIVIDQVQRLIVVTRGDLTPGLQLAQSGHAISQFFLEQRELAEKWNNQYLISLSVPSKEKLETLLLKLMKKNISVSYFTEPDLDDELTSISFIETLETKGLTSSLPLTLSEFNKQLTF